MLELQAGARVEVDVGGDETHERQRDCVDDARDDVEERQRRVGEDDQHRAEERPHEQRDRGTHPDERSHADPTASYELGAPAERAEGTTILELDHGCDE